MGGGEPQNQTSHPKRRLGIAKVLCLSRFPQGGLTESYQKRSGIKKKKGRSGNINGTRKKKKTADPENRPDRFLKSLESRNIKGQVKEKGGEGESGTSGKYSKPGPVRFLKNTLAA